MSSLLPWASRAEIDTKPLDFSKALAIIETQLRKSIALQTKQELPKVDDKIKTPQEFITCATAHLVNLMKVIDDGLNLWCIHLSAVHEIAEKSMMNAHSDVYKTHQQQLEKLWVLLHRLWCELVNRYHNGLRLWQHLLVHAPQALKPVDAEPAVIIQDYFQPRFEKLYQKIGDNQEHFMQCIVRFDLSLIHI